MRPERRQARGKLAVVSREASRHPDDPSITSELEDTRREYGALALEDHIERAVARFGPFTDEQRAKLAVLLAPSAVDADGGGDRAA